MAKLRIPKTTDIIKYALDTTSLSPDELFTMMESAEGYTGDSYNMWLASMIVESAKSEGVSQSQILTNKSTILYDLSLQDKDTFGETVIMWMKSKFNNPLLFNFEEEQGLEDIDWFSSIDYLGNPLFVSELPEELSSVIEDGTFNLLFFSGKDLLTKEAKEGDLFRDAKMKKIPLKYMYQGYIHQMCLLYDLYGKAGVSKFGFVVPCDVFSDPECKKQMWELLDRFEVTGYRVTSSSKFTNGYAFCVCVGGKSSRDYITLCDTKVTLEDNTFKEEKGKEVVYTYSNKRYSEYLKGQDIGTDRVPIEEKGKVIAVDMGVKSALAYLNFGNRLTVTTLKTRSSYEDLVSVPITEDNLLSVMFYFGMFKANKGNGNFTDITIPVIGNQQCNMIARACIPLLEFCEDNMTKEFVIKTSNGEMRKYHNRLKEALNKLEEASSVYYPFEAKDLSDIGKEIDSLFVGKNYTMREKVAILSEDYPDLKMRYDRAKRSLESWIYSNSIGVI